MYSYTYDHLTLNGRLGNQLWQTAWQIGSAVKSDGQACIKPDWDYRKYFCVPDEMFGEPVGQIVDGRTFYYQELYHWEHCQDLIFDYFQPSHLSWEYMIANYPGWLLDMSCHKTAIHVRAGDFLEQPRRFPVPTDRYYAEAMELSKPDTIFVIFSDNIEYAKMRFKDVRRDMYFVEGIPRPIDPKRRIGDPQDQWDMFLISLCDEHIISNSTFSWWGAFLSAEQQAFYPSVWFGPDLVVNDSRGIDVKQSWRDGIPKGWRMIEC